MSRNTSIDSIACLFIDRFPIKAERQRYPVLRKKPLILAESRGPRKIIVHSSAEAAGVNTGMSLRDALANCPEAHVLQADNQFYGEVFDRIIDALRARFAAVTPVGPGCAFVQLKGLPSLFCGEARLAASLLQAVPEIFQPQVGVASTRLSSYASAVTAGPGRASLAPSDDASLLHVLSLDLLPLDSESKLRLKTAGIRSLADLSSMPTSVAQANLSPEDRHSGDLARILEYDRSRDLALEAA